MRLVHVALSRRAALMLAPLLAVQLPAAPPATASTDFPAQVKIVNTPELCQARCRDQDFVAIKYIGRRTDTGAIFDDRYAKQPLIFEIGSFYLPDVDAGLESACVGSKLRFFWPRSPPLGAEFEAALPAGTPIELELELVTIKYSLFGEKMKARSIGEGNGAPSSYRFTPGPVTLTSAADFERGHASLRAPVITKDNPFSIAAGENNLISNPSSVLGPLWQAGKGLPKF